MMGMVMIIIVIVMMIMLPGVAFIGGTPAAGRALPFPPLIPSLLRAQQYRRGTMTDAGRREGPRRLPLAASHVPTHTPVRAGMAPAP